MGSIGNISTIKDKEALQLHLHFEYLEQKFKLDTKVLDTKDETDS